ncbi:MAG: cob(I)yrinic acid a,c-diamide adenosyltransferase [Kiritimatiellae bacterium]|nr:cob(I)yrinic acid a,c-diamide adenosyltransferase [Kiritimatiellia bacterium]
MVLLTGDGKGKTSSALGMVLRAAGNGLCVCLIHFIKQRQDTGETAALRRFPEVEEHFCGRGFVARPSPARLAEHRAAAAAGLALATDKLRAVDVGMVVLDEICGAVALGLIAKDDLLAALRQARPGQIVVLTGRNACPELMALADTVSRIECVKHGIDAGWPAQRGVEW